VNLRSCDQRFRKILIKLRLRKRKSLISDWLPATGVERRPAMLPNPQAFGLALPVAASDLL
jgi:hypothetical protein